MKLLKDFSFAYTTIRLAKEIIVCDDGQTKACPTVFILYVQYRNDSRFLPYGTQVFYWTSPAKTLLPPQAQETFNKLSLVGFGGE
jgi:hypothetical protein